MLKIYIPNTNSLGYTTEKIFIEIKTITTTIFIEIKTKTTGICRPHTLLMRASLHDIMVIFKQSYLRVSCHSIDHRLSPFTSLIGR